MSTILDLVGRDPKRPPAQPIGQPPIRITVMVDTPMFLAGANQHHIEHELLRVPSLRGLLRWWWRAAQSYQDLERLRNAEAAIWGSLPTKELPHPQRGVVIRSTTLPHPRTTTVTGGTGSAEFYLSYGLGENRGATTGNHTQARPGFAPGQTADLEIFAHTDPQRYEVELALSLLLAFGGLGSRNRRSWGSLSAAHRDGAVASRPRFPAEVQTHLGGLLDRVPARTVDGSAVLRSLLGRHARVETARCAFTHHELLNTAHAIFKGPDKLHKEAWCFGLPHTRGKGAAQDGPQWVDRRASPIMLKATRLADDQYALSALLLDGAFLDFVAHAGDATAFQQQRAKLGVFLDRVRDCQAPMKIMVGRR